MGRGHPEHRHQAELTCGGCRTTKAAMCGLFDLERVMGIEPTSKAWEALVLPLNYTRTMGKFYGDGTPAAIGPSFALFLRNGTS